MSIVKKYDGTTFNSVYAINHYDGTKQSNDNIKPLEFNSIYFDGNGDYLQLSDNTDWEFGSDNFTLEAQIYSNGTTGTIFSHQQNTGSRAFEIRIDSNGYVVAYFRSATTTYTISTSLNIFNSQKHVAVVRYSNLFSIYIDGTSQGSQVISESINDASYPLYIGIYDAVYSTSFLAFNGYMANVRISKGVARYTSNFNPSKQIPQLDQYTKLLISGESPISDISGKSITVTGNTLATKKYTNIYTDSCNAIYFDGSGDTLNLSDNSDFLLGGSNNQTFEFQIYPTSNTYNQYIFSKADNNVASFANYALLYVGSSQYVAFQVRKQTGSSYPTLTTGASNYSSPLNTQSHVALVSNNDTLTFYINGISDTVNTSIGDIGTYSMPNIKLGYLANGYSSSTVKYFAGYLSNFRFSKGIARYTANFNIYRTKLSVDSYTKLLITGESPISDKSGKSVTVAGNTTSTKIYV